MCPGKESCVGRAPGLGTHRLFLALTVMGPVEAAPEYRVIVDANNLTVEIENELSECGGKQTALPGVGGCRQGPAGLSPSPSCCPSPASAAVAGAALRRKSTSLRVEVRASGPGWGLVWECLLPRLFTYLFS